MLLGNSFYIHGVRALEHILFEPREVLLFWVPTEKTPYSTPKIAQITNSEWPLV